MNNIELISINNTQKEKEEKEEKFRHSKRKTEVKFLVNKKSVEDDEKIEEREREKENLNKCSVLEKEIFINKQGVFLTKSMKNNLKNRKLSIANSKINSNKSLTIVSANEEGNENMSTSRLNFTSKENSMYGNKGNKMKSNKIKNKNYQKMSKTEKEYINRQEKMKRKLANFIVYNNYLETEQIKNKVLNHNTVKVINNYNKEFGLSDPKLVRLKNFLETVPPPKIQEKSLYYKVGMGVDLKGKIITNDKSNIFYKSNFFENLSNDIAFKYRHLIAHDFKDPALKIFQDSYYQPVNMSRRVKNNKQEEFED